jgi:peptide/nickel transport system substrate-binding protein
MWAIRAVGHCQRRMRGRRITAWSFYFFIGAMAAVVPASGQQRGGVLRVYHRDSPGSMSIHEEGTISTIIPMMGVFNNLVVFDPQVPQDTMTSIIPDLATGWRWSDDGTELTFTLRDGVNWHDGKPFTAQDVKCTWNLLADRAPQKFRVNFRAPWYGNLAEVTTYGDRQVTFHLRRRQPAFLSFLASGVSPVYPCHVSPQEMRQHPIGTGPFRFLEFKPNVDIKLVRNPDYWKPGRPYLDGIDYAIIPDRSTAVLSFIAGQQDMTFPYEVTPALRKQINSDDPGAICQTVPLNVSVTMLVNRRQPPFDNPDLRRAMALAVDHSAFLHILGEGQAYVGGVMLPPPDGVWGLPSDMLADLPGFDPDVGANRERARAIMTHLGYGPTHPLKVTLAARDLALYRDPATILMDQLRQIWIDGDLNLIETANFGPMLNRHDFSLVLSLVGDPLDEPDQDLYENYTCGSPRNYGGYCNPEVDRLIEAQSMEPDLEKRKNLVWQIDRRLQEDGARTILYHLRGTTCWQPQVKGISLAVNSIYNNWRMEDLWLDR